MIIRHQIQSVGSWADLVRAYPPSEFATGTRSTLALLDYWRDPTRAISEYSDLGVNASDDISLSFEHLTPVQAGTGKASHTDLMIQSLGSAVAVEAKHTEPQYELVSEWYGLDPTPNRKLVLGGWLGLIARVSGAELDATSVSALPYQMIHRSAAACSMGRDRTSVVYHLFGNADAAAYATHLAAMSALCGRSRRICFILLQTPLQPTPFYRALLASFKEAALTTENVRRAVLDGPLYEFGTTVAKTFP